MMLVGGHFRNPQTWLISTNLEARLKGIQPHKLSKLLNSELGSCLILMVIDAKMEKKRKITQYRERLDKTLASPDLKNEERLKTLVKDQLLLSSKDETKGLNEKLIDKRTAEVSYFLDMLRSVSVNDNEGLKASEKSHAEWKLKQDNEEFRVMYREGPQGTPFHTLLVEGFVDGPVDICLCISWETSLYKKWWPQFSIPTFKVVSCKCLQKVQIGEQISLVRVKVSWPLSTREVVVHYVLFEYFQDDLIVVLLNSISDSEDIDITTHGFTSEAIPEADDVVRIDVVGGFALQKVTPERSYFQDNSKYGYQAGLCPPIPYKLYFKAAHWQWFQTVSEVSSMFKSDEDFSKALGRIRCVGLVKSYYNTLTWDPLYTKIREALYSTNVWDMVFAKRPEVEQALGTLEKVISMVREYGFNAQTRFSSGVTSEEPPIMEKGLLKDSNSSEDERVCSNGEVIVEVSKKEIIERTSQEQPRNSSSNHSFRRAGSNSHSREVNHNKVAPASPEQYVSVPSEANQVALCSPGNGNVTTEVLTLDQSAYDINQINTEANGSHKSSLNGDKSSKQKKHRFCCFVSASARH
uniref:START domain-containing protein n=1 Tax=Fagus sylvatica TaxID=28930 RepID=A0A2N9FPL5_FAGSY